MDEKALLVLLTIVFLVLQFVFHLVTKQSNKEVIDKMDTKFEKMLQMFDDRTRELANEIQNKRSGYAGAIREMSTGIHDILVMTKQSTATQQVISDNMLKLSITQQDTSRIQERLEEKLSAHAATTSQTQERFEEKLNLHAADCKERNLALRQAQGVA